MTILLATATLLAMVAPAKDKTPTPSAQSTESAPKDSKATKEAKHKKAATNHDAEGASGTPAAKKETPKK